MSSSEIELLDPAGEETLIHQQNNRLLRERINEHTSRLDQIDDLVLTPGTPWEGFSPVLTATTTNPDVGAGSISGAFVQMGQMVIARFFVEFGAGFSAGSGAYFLTTPVNLVAGGTGSGYVFDASAGFPYAINPIPFDAGRVLLWQTGVAPMAHVTHASPIAWASGDQIVCGAIFEAA